MLEIVKERTVVLGKEGDGSPVLTRSTRPANAVSVIFNRLRHVVVDDQRNVFDVDTTACHVRRDENVFCTRFKVRQGKFTLFLTFATVQCASIELQREKNPLEVFK